MEIPTIPVDINRKERMVSTTKRKLHGKGNRKGPSFSFQESEWFMKRKQEWHLLSKQIGHFSSQMRLWNGIGHFWKRMQGFLGSSCSVFPNKSLVARTFEYVYRPLKLEVVGAVRQVAWGRGQSRRSAMLKDRFLETRHTWNTGSPPASSLL